MIRIQWCAAALVAGVVSVVGCNPNKPPPTSPTKSVSELGKEFNAATKEQRKAAKENYVKPMKEELAKLDEKIKGMSGDAKVKAEERRQELAKKLDEFENASEEKWADLKVGVDRAYDDLKDAVK